MTFRGTRRQAERELARLVVEQEAKPAPIPEEPVRWGPTTTINDAISAWRNNGWDVLSPKTTRGYEEIWKRYVLDSIGRRRIASLSPYEVERFFRQLKTAGAKRDTVRRVKSLLHRACRLAARWSGGVLANPVANTELPSWTLSELSKPVRAPDVEDVRKLLVAAHTLDERFGAFVRVVAATGMRRGEAACMRWSDLDWENSSVTVDESVVAAKGGAVVKGPKTRASIRRLSLDPGTMDELGRLRKVQDDLAAICEVPLSQDGFVFSLEPGGQQPPHPDSMSHTFSRVRKLAGVAADIHLHSLRHFQATALDPVLSERQKQARLGWATVHMARHYTDALEDQDRIAATHIGGLLDGPAPTD
jgi:integrase